MFKKDKMKFFLALISTLIIISCGDKVREEITERYQSGNKKILIKYKGEGSNEVVEERIYYSQNGDTLFRENTTKEYVYYNTKEEVTKSYSDGQKEKLLKSRFTMKDDLNDYEITDKYVFDESGEVVFHEDVLEDTLFVKTLEKISKKFSSGKTKEFIKYEKNYDLIDDEILFTTKFNENGDTISHFNNWTEDGFQRFYSDLGFSLFTYKDGLMKGSLHYSNGKIQYVIKDGYLTYYYENGNKKYEGNCLECMSILDYTKNDKWTYYYQNGKIKSVGDYNDNDKDGRWYYYDENGKEKYWEDWNLGDLSDSNRNGEYVTYYENNSIKEVYNYKKGILNGSYFYYREDGSLKKEGQYKFGTESGIWKYYDSDGTRWKTGVWRDGQEGIFYD